MIARLKKEIAKTVIGHEEMVEALLIALVTEGHVLIEGVPGLAKTTTVKALASACDLSFGRVQFTPDLLPSDVTGAQIFDMRSHTFSVRKGPLFANLVLCDEINRAPAKVQSALLEAMQERQVTIGDETFALPAPFVVLATQNPLEEEGVYPLPEAQLDRFMLKIVATYGSKTEEVALLHKVHTHIHEAIEKVLSANDLFSFRMQVNNIHCDDELIDYIAELTRQTRPENNGDLVNHVRAGVGPRGGMELLKGAKAKAWLSERDYVLPSDIAALIFPVFRHRIVLRYEAMAENISSDDVIKSVLRKVFIP